MEKSLLIMLKAVKEYILSVSNDHVIELFDERQCDEIDQICKEAKDHFIIAKRNECIANLVSCRVEHTDHFGRAFNAYNEIMVYQLLKQKGKIIPVNECMDESTPDFIFTNLHDQQVNIELKTLHFNDGIYNYRKMQEQHTISRIELEKARNNEPYSSDSLTIVTSPFRKMRRNGPINRKIVIESLIDKVQNSYKQSQLTYRGNPGILLIDTKVFRFPYYEQEALPYHIIKPLDTLVSGCLWHCCFGKAGERTFDWIPSYGEKNIGDVLEKNGVLFGEGSLKAIIFLIHVIGQPRFIGFVRSGPIEEAVLFSLGQVCDFINDECNRQVFRSLSMFPFGTQRD